MRLGCNVAWGLVDAVMCLLRTATGRTHLRRIGYQVILADNEHARRIIKKTLPDYVRVLGFALGRHAGYRSPLHTGFAMAALGVALIAMVIALGG